MKVKVMQVGPIGTNCYILEDEATNKAAVIDPGDEGDRILSVLKEDGVQVEYILLTHGHYDHTTAVPDLIRALPQAEVYIHQADANGAGSQLFPLAGQVADLKYYNEGDTLTLGSLTIQVLHTPGHSKGSVTLQVGDVLFTGDTLFCGSWASWKGTSTSAPAMTGPPRWSGSGSTTPSSGKPWGNEETIL